MNCRETEPLLLAETDGALTAVQRAALDAHVAGCAGCRQLRSRLVEVLAAYRADVASVPVPDVAEEWRTLRAQLSGEKARPPKKRPLAPVIWFGSSLAAAAALTFAFLSNQPKRAELFSPDNDIASAEFVEAGDPNASTVVYVDKDSGWLVVWATNADAKTSG